MVEGRLRRKSPKRSSSAGDLAPPAEAGASKARARLGLRPQQPDSKPCSWRGKNSHEKCTRKPATPVGATCAGGDALDVAGVRQVGRVASAFMRNASMTRAA